MKNKKIKNTYKIPKNTQDTIPFQEAYKDGIFHLGENVYSITFRFDDINYSASSDEDKRKYFFGYSDIINSLDSDSVASITIINNVSGQEYSKGDYNLKYANSETDVYRYEYNNMLEKQAFSTNTVYQDKFLTLTKNKNTVDDARHYFNHQETELNKSFNKIGSRLIKQNAMDRLYTLSKIYRKNQLDFSLYDWDDIFLKGHSVKDYIAPDYIKFSSDYFLCDGRYGRILFFRNYASYIKDSIIDEICSLPVSIILNINIRPISSEEAIKEAERRRLAVETNIHNWQMKQQRSRNASAILPYKMEHQREETNEFLNDLIKRDQRMLINTISILQMADTKEELDIDTNSIISVASSNRCDLGRAVYQQLEGLQTVLPLGVCRLPIERTMTTESTAVFIPFKTQDVSHENGIYYGYNAISNNMIFIDKSKLLNGNSFIFGVSGSGKSFAAKMEIIANALKGDVDIIIIDPEKEYQPVVQALGGETIKISASSNHHINAMDINANYGETNNPLTDKSEYLLSLCEMASGSISPNARSIIDRCTRIVYKDYIKSGYKTKAPTLLDFYTELKSQKEAEAGNIALALEVFVTGSLNVFAKETNVDMDSKLICFDINSLGSQLYNMGLLVMLDSIFNRITRNRDKNITTYVYIDEIYLLFEHQYSAVFLYHIWKRIRKYGGYITGITQNVTELLSSSLAQQMLANSELLVLLGQSPTDREAVTELLEISELQKNYITDVGAGSGLIKVGSALVPFRNDFPKDTELYRLMSTKPKEF